MLVIFDEFGSPQAKVVRRLLGGLDGDGPRLLDGD